MFPIINVFGIFQIYSFGIIITACFFLFVWMLNRLSKRLDFKFDIFSNNILWLFISIFCFSRIFYIVSKWNDLKYIDNFLEFFIMREYNFSLMGGIFGFLLVFFILLKIRKENLDKYIYGIMLSFLFILPLGYIGAFLGGQVYGVDTNLGIEIIYTNNMSPVPYKSPIFPLPIVYSIVFFLIFSAFYIINIYVKQKALLGYLSLISFSFTIFFLEYFSGKHLPIKESLGINLNQIFAILLVIFGIYRIYKIYTKNIRV